MSDFENHELHLLPEITFQVAPAELEDLLLAHPLIRDAAVIGVPNKKTGELPKAFVVRANNTLTEEEVKDWVKDKVSPYKQLAGGVEFINEIPKSAAGKILRRELRDRAVSKL
ncbi:unnamed protein product [Nippostrongylus brasiliensis]|uniref:AMP-binding enzyme C-terminal domain-containing protein n=1 Tax=Nippostrongylus brasiliensis TaxID=27835 RepID=A0A3P7C0F2_NIPBR|nr:unnamed protein product [Nippostrongylus brasiliensis]VDL86788.1 unnamed protein product [Nippostrongylus brasiliensis]